MATGVALYLDGDLLRTTSLPGRRAFVVCDAGGGTRVYETLPVISKQKARVP